MAEGKELKDQRVPIMMTPSELEAIDEWSWQNRIRSRGEAIRRLCQMGLIFERELRPVMDSVVEHIRASAAQEKERLTPDQHQQMFQDMAISLVNAKTAFAKLEGQPLTDEAIESLTSLYEYWRTQK